MKKVTAILLVMVLGTVAFAATDPVKDLDTQDYVISDPGRMVIDGVLADGTVEPVMRGGEWAFAVAD